VRNSSVAALRGTCYQRFARQIAPEYDVRISAYNPTDWGLPAIHFIADFSWHSEIRDRFDPITPGFVYRNSFLRRAYLRIAQGYARPSGRDVLRDDQVIANSQWTSALMKQECGVECSAVVYPSVWTTFPAVAWEDKTDAFVMIGRIAPEKQVERAITILDAVRKRGHRIRFHLCGKISDDLYSQRIARLCKEHADWIVVEGQVAGERKARLLASCRFGIQTREAEPFGISVAEMIKAGAIVFAPNNGGQAEVLEHADLLYTGDRDAVAKISSVLSNPQSQAALRKHLLRHSELFSSANFMEAAQTQVSTFVRAVPMVRRRPKVAIGHPSLGYGGSESTVMWLIEALKQDYEVTVVTTSGWDRQSLNAFYGTSVQEHEVKIRIAPIPFAMRKLSAAALRGACYQRFARQIASEYDLRISAYNPTDWGLPAVHFIADFSWHQEIRERLDPATPGFIYQDSILRKLYLRIANTYAKPSGRDVLRDDMVIANSHWTAALMKEACGVACSAVVYPSVWSSFPEIPWDEKEEAFVMIGRIAPEKQVERAITILDGVRKRGHSIRLHLCGHIGDDLYGQRIARLCHQHSDWIVVEGQVAGARKAELLAGCRFGIQTREAEPFGISVAEMIKAGAIVFAPSDGGQAEILKHPLLLFTSNDEAVERISDALNSKPLQLELRTHLRGIGTTFSTSNFIHASRTLLKRALPVELPWRPQHA
jgi:glycosyltransferase involved in cell wall biosynthesis